MVALNAILSLLSCTLGAADPITDTFLTTPRSGTMTVAWKISYRSAHQFEHVGNGFGCVAGAVGRISLIQTLTLFSVEESRVTFLHQFPSLRLLLHFTTNCRTCYIESIRYYHCVLLNLD
jgi:hypothetical protein